MEKVEITTVLCGMRLITSLSHRRRGEDRKMGPFYLAIYHCVERRSAAHKPRSAFYFIRTLGMEAVIFVGGVSLGQPATSIPIAAIVGLICGLVCGFIIYQFASRASMSFSTSFMFSGSDMLSISFDNLPGCYDQPPLAHRCRVVQQSSRCVRRKRL